MQDGNNVVYIARVNGSAYEMGYALGQVFADEISANMQNMIKYGMTKVDEVCDKLHVDDDYCDQVFEDVEPILFELLDLNYEIAEPYIPQRYKDELQIGRAHV